MMLIMNTCPDKKSANKLAKSLVEKKLAACVTILPTEKSIYRWKGKIEEDKEWVLLIKTKDRLFQRVKGHIKANHPHSVPEVIGFKIDNGLESYLSWVGRSTI
jgi:periplasmic divalent cation tolerance protein